MVADELGFKALIKELEEDNFDAYFIHLAGIDHAGHNGGVKEPKLYNMTIESVDDKLWSLLQFTKESKHKFLVTIFGDHG